MKVTDAANYLVKNSKSLVNKNMYTKRRNRNETKGKLRITVGLINSIYENGRLYKSYKGNPNNIEFKLQYTRSG